VRLSIYIINNSGLKYEVMFARAR